MADRAPLPLEDQQLAAAFAMPVSIAIAGPLSLIVPIPAIFIVAGVAPTLLAIVALLAGRMRDVETRHPLDT